MLYYKRHIGDYIRDTAHLSLLEHGVYTRLLDVYYVKETPLSDAEAVRLIKAKSKAEVAAVKCILKEFWTPTEKGWIQSRCDHEINRAHGKIEANQENGKKGGRPRVKKSDSEPNENPVGLSSETQSVNSDIPNITLSNDPIIQLSNDPIIPPHPPDLERVGDKGKGSYDPNEAWRDIEGCDVQAHETWLEYRSQAGDPVPPHTRIVNAKFLAGKGYADVQRTYVDELIRLQFKRLHDPVHGAGVGKRPGSSGHDKVVV